MTKRSVFPVLLLVCALPLAASGAAVSDQTDLSHRMTILMLQLGTLTLVSRLLGHLFQNVLKQPRVLGELAAGMLVGPFALGAIPLPVVGGPLFPVAEGPLPVSPELYGIAVLASIVLLFLSGLETDLPTFLRFSLVGTGVGLGGVIVSFLFGSSLSVLLLPGVDSFLHPTALFLGTLSTATSVGITARILSEKKKMASPEGVTILAGAVLDDVIGIVLLAVVVGVTRAGEGGTVSWGPIGMIALKAFGFWLVCTAVGIVVAPWLSRGLKRFHSLELIAGVSFGIALLLAGISERAGLAMIIGAYVTGLSLSRTDVAFEIRERLHGLYRFLVPIFFAVMGMMVNFTVLGGVVGFGLAFAAAAIAGKIIGCGIPALLSGFNLRGAFRIGAGMLPRGEVTLIVAGIGLSSGAIGPDLFGVAIMTLLVASVVAPPVLINSFNGGTGIKASAKMPKEDTPMREVVLEFPYERIARFVFQEILAGFRAEAFLVQALDREQGLGRVQKDDTLVTLTVKSGRLTVSMKPSDERFVRLLLLEVVLGLKDVFEGVREMQGTERIGKELLDGFFD